MEIKIEIYWLYVSPEQIQSSFEEKLYFPRIAILAFFHKVTSFTKNLLPVQARYGSKISGPYSGMMYHSNR